MQHRWAIKWLAAGLLAAMTPGASARQPTDAPKPPATPSETKPETKPDSNSQTPKFIRPTTRIARPPEVRPFNPETDVRSAIDAAMKRGKRNHRHVLVLWGDNDSVWAARLFDQTLIPAISHALLYHYEVVWADIADPTIGPINSALLQGYGIAQSPKIGRKEMPYLTIIAADGKDAGKPLVARSTKGLENERKLKAGQYDFNTLLLEEFLLGHKPTPVDASEVLDAANKEAAERHVPVMLVFDEVADGWCIRFRWWLDKPEVSAVMDKHFVVTRIDLNRMTGGFPLMDSVSKGKSTASPWYVFQDSVGKRLAPAEDGSEDLGFPTGDEIPKFIQMLKKASPGLTDEEAGVITLSLEAEAQPPAAGK